ncbi:hypothetical protein KGM_202853 [Danaus plexippus plexippus]|uniref:Uncharacterized protein n=1 Tax=Danaus plexippus plexippus TaxID=278856 RepID=A0A212F205_DANPL|nr:hypothetical protein KGM_202853 [Danaus plexippus plexippus]
MEVTSILGGRDMFLQGSDRGVVRPEWKHLPILSSHITSSPCKRRPITSECTRNKTIMVERAGRTKAQCAEIRHALPAHIEKHGAVLTEHYNVMYVRKSNMT